MARLELVNEGVDGWRHYLDGKPIHDGDTLELLTGEGWRRGCFQWSFRRDERPILFWDDCRGVVLYDDDELRWPVPHSRRRGRKPA